MAKVLIVSYFNESKEIKFARPEVEFDLVLMNHPSAIGRLFNVKEAEKIYISASVMEQGLLPDMVGILRRLRASNKIPATGVVEVIV